MAHENTPPADDPTLAGLRQDRVAVQRDESARLKAAVTDRSDVCELRAAARPKRALIEVFIAEHGPTLHARRVELAAPEHVRRPLLAPLRQAALDEIRGIEELFSNAAAMRKADERLDRLTLEEVQPSGYDAPFLPDAVARLLGHLRAGIDAVRALHEQWTAHEANWAELGRRRAELAPVLAPGNSQQPDRQLETPPPPKGRFAKSSLRSGDAA